MKKAVWIVVALLVIAAGVWMARGYQAKEVNGGEKPVVKIGVVLSLTGADPEGAKNSQNALLYVAETLKNSPVKYELIFEDSHAEPVKGINAARKLTEYDKVTAVFSNISGVSKAIAPYLAEKGVMHVAFSSDRETASGKTNFVFWISAEEYADKMADWLNRKGYSKVAALVNSDATSMQRYQALEKRLAQSNITLNKTEFIPGTRDFRIAISKALSTDSDVFLLLAPLPELDIAAKQLAEACNTKHITSMDFINYSQNKSRFEGDEFVSTPDGNPKVVEEIMKAVGTENPFGIAYMNDVMEILNKVVSEFYYQNNRTPTGTEIADGLTALKNYSGAVGDIIISPEGVINPQAIIKKIVNGRPVIVEE